MEYFGMLWELESFYVPVSDVSFTQHTQALHSHLPNLYDVRVNPSMWEITNAWDLPGLPWNLCGEENMPGGQPQACES